MPLDLGYVRPGVARIERLNRAIDRLQARKSEAYKELKKQGLDVQVIREVVGRRATNAHHSASADPTVRLYEEQLDGLSPNGPGRP